ncbi:hypothetical protein [Algoriphagus boritolerans]|uniref:hypothetical protein n=1 Tax=Algoriphagus boritolerans TaxID=308111 RepID=UPI002FCE521B
MDDLSNLAKAFVQPTAFRTNLLSFKRSVVANKIASLNAANVSNTTLKKKSMKKQSMQRKQKPTQF